MGKLSRYTNRHRLSDFINRFWDAITLIEDREEAVTFLKDLLTPTEIGMLSKRLQVADMLAKDYNYEAIRNFVNVTSQTISSVNNKLSFGNDGLIKILQRLEKIDQKKQGRLEGKRNIFGQPPGMGRSASNLLDKGITKIIRSHQKKASILKAK